MSATFATAAFNKRAYPVRLKHNVLFTTRESSPSVNTFRTFDGLNAQPAFVYSVDAPQRCLFLSEPRGSGRFAQQESLATPLFRLFPMFGRRQRGNDPHVQAPDSGDSREHLSRIVSSFAAERCRKRDGKVKAFNQFWATRSFRHGLSALGSMSANKCSAAVVDSEMLRAESSSRPSGT